MKEPRPRPTFRHERACMAQGARFICGVDEVGRGPLAGPVTAAAVILPRKGIPRGLDDSKKLSPAKRRQLAEQIKDCADWSIAHASVAEIGQLNIHYASHLAMRRAVAGLRQRPCMALVDGKRLPWGLDCPAEAIVRGDAACLSIAAASIIAKVERDRIMADLAQQFPGYGWEQNMGYPTEMHRQALAEKGATPFHRMGFPAIHKILCPDPSLNL